MAEHLLPSWVMHSMLVRDGLGKRGIRDNRSGRQATEQARCVYVADREADIVSLMVRAAELEHPADWLIRSNTIAHYRKVDSYGRR